MMTTMKSVAAGALALALAGCVSSTITNLTATQQPRNPTGQYLIECAWASSQATLRPETISPQVIVGFDNYPMQRVLHLTNRWQTFVPVPPGQDALRYHFKVDYEYNRFGGRGTNSLQSKQEYKLVIVDK
jgi:hypothetical protein